MTSWFGVGVRAGTPAEICDKIEAGVVALCKEQVVRDRLANLVSETVGSGRAEFAAYVAAERARWGKLITEMKIKAE